MLHPDEKKGWGLFFSKLILRKSSIISTILERGKDALFQSSLTARPLGSGGRFHHALDIDCVILAVGVLGRPQFPQWEEQGAAAGHIHLRDGSVEGCRREVWTESIDDMLPLVLIYEKERYLQERSVGGHGKC